MSEELETELLDERKFEQWMKKQSFNDNLEKAIRFAEETKEQFEEKISVLSGNMENVISEIKDIETKLSTVDDRLSTVDKSIGTVHIGIDSIKEDVKKFQTSQDSLEKLVQEKYQTSQDSLEKLVQEKYQTLHEDLENVKDIETKLGTVDDRLSTVDKSIGTLYTGIDGIKEDVKKFQTSQDSLEKLVQEKYQTLHEDLENVKDIETKLGTVDKSIGTLYTGIDGIKEDVKKFQISQDSLEKLVQEKYQTLHEDLENVKDIETKLGTVDKSIGILHTGIDGIKEDVKKFQTLHEDLEKLVQEKYQTLHKDLENVKGVETKLGAVDDRLDTIDKSIGALCTGIDCILEDVKKFQTSHDSLEKLVQEKILVLCGNIENVTREIIDVGIKLGTVDDRLDAVDKSIGTFSTGIDHVNEDVKKFQTSQDSLEKLVQEKYQTLHEDLEKSHDVLEKLVQERFKELGEKVQSLERPTFTCENCGEQTIAPLSSYCSNCGSEIQSWSDEDGQPVRGWTPYWKRSGRSTSQ